MASKEMQFAFEAWGMNNTTKKSFTIVPGKEPTVTVIPGQINKISIGVTVTHIQTPLARNRQSKRLNHH